VTHPAWLLLVLAGLAQPARAQDDGTRPRTEVAGLLTVTTKGISTIPSFTLGKPAVIADVSIARRGLSFEPQFRFGLDGKPWSFLFWGRYRLHEGERLHVEVGAHPALNFRATQVSIRGAPREVIVARRYLAGELSPSYSLSRSVNVGTYYLYSYGVEEDVTKHTHFLALRANLTTVGLPAQYVARFTPQVYYLRTDDRDGTYLNAGLTLSRRNLPVSVSTTVNRTIRTSVAGDDVLWNVNLHYAIR
jgi:hypothetical protein